MKALFLIVMLGLIVPCSSAEDELAEKGGHSFLLSLQGRVDDGGAKIPVTMQDVERVIRAIKGRLEGMGIASMSVSRGGDDEVIIEVPGMGAEEAARISAMLEKPCRLGVYGVSPRNDEVDDKGITFAQRVQDGDEIVPGFRACPLRVKDEDGNDHEIPVLINRRKALGGEDIAMAAPSPNQPDAVLVTLNAKGAEKMIALTKNMRPKLDRIAIVLDGEVVSAPILMQPPLGKNFVIDGLNKPGEAKSLAVSLMYPLETPVKVQKVRSIPPAGK